MKAIVWSFFKRKTVLCIAAMLAIVSAFLMKPDREYIAYIDFRVLALLFCLMTVVAGWQKIGLFQQLGFSLSCRVKSARELILVLVGLCFFTSMLITNDVALITFVPFTISLFHMGHDEKRLIPVIVLETISTNLGSMLTPIGNPQNLYLFSLSQLSAVHFLLAMLPLSLVSLLLIVTLVFLQKNELFQAKSLPLQADRETARDQKNLFHAKEFWIFTALFLICLGNIVHLIYYPVVLFIVISVVLLTDHRLLKQVDYSLLVTFICFFIFVGNMSRIPAVSDLLQRLITGRELWMGILTSQVISNVPTAVLLSGFTQDYRSLLWGVNIGGLGTLIASMASLISYRYYVNSKDAAKGRYITVFTGYNLLLLLILSLFAWLVL